MECMIRTRSSDIRMNDAHDALLTSFGVLSMFLPTSSLSPSYKKRSKPMSFPTRLQYVSSIFLKGVFLLILKNTSPSCNRYKSDAKLWALCFRQTFEYAVDPYCIIYLRLILLWGWCVLAQAWEWVSHLESLCFRSIGKLDTVKNGSESVQVLTKSIESCCLSSRWLEYCWSPLIIYCCASMNDACFDVTTKYSNPERVVGLALGLANTIYLYL